MLLQPGPVQGPAEGGQRVHQPELGIHRLRIVVVPPRLLLLAAAMVIDGQRGDPGLPGRVGQQNRGPATVRTDLQERQPEPPGVQGCLMEGQPLTQGHEPLGGLEGGEDLGLGCGRGHGFPLGRRSCVWADVVRPRCGRTSSPDGPCCRTLRRVGDRGSGTCCGACCWSPRGTGWRGVPWVFRWHSGQVAGAVGQMGAAVVGSASASAASGRAWARSEWPPSVLRPSGRPRRNTSPPWGGRGCVPASCVRR